MSSFPPRPEMRSPPLDPHSTSLAPVPDSLPGEANVPSQARRVVMAASVYQGKKSMFGFTESPVPMPQSDGPVAAPHQLSVTSTTLVVLFWAPMVLPLMEL